MTIIVTGGAGFLGARLIAALLEDGAERIVSLDRVACPVDDARVESLVGSIDDAYAVARALSGGNLQKFVIGREVLQAPRVLVVNQPTWGVDAGAAAAVRQSLLDLARQGAGIIVISQDLDELLELSDRFCALNEGRLSPPVPTDGLTLDRIGLMLGGAHGMEEARI